ncbi:MAG: hypothetical protein RL708_2400 [Bacteroidota bacterium]|jgi:hypothetical protein
MSQPIVEIRQHLHESIENIHDTTVLNVMKEIADHQYIVVSEPQLSEYQISRIAEAKQQIESGNFYTNQQAKELFNKWLTK